MVELAGACLPHPLARWSYTAAAIGARKATVLANGRIWSKGVWLPRLTR